MKRVTSLKYSSGNELLLFIDQKVWWGSDISAWWCINNTKTQPRVKFLFLISDYVDETIHNHSLESNGGQWLVSRFSSLSPLVTTWLCWVSETASIKRRKKNHSPWFVECKWTMFFIFATLRYHVDNRTTSWRRRSFCVCKAFLTSCRASNESDDIQENNRRAACSTKELHLFGLFGTVKHPDNWIFL
jgi:hypothetical protein